MQILTSLALLKELSSDVEQITTTTQTLQPLEGTTSKDVTVVRKEDTLPATWGATVAAGISTGVDVVSRTVEKGTELANKAIVMVSMLSW